MRSSAQRVRPWQWTRGPQTAAGKARSSRNALKHGMRTAEAIAEKREAAELLRLCRMVMDEEEDLLDE